VGSAADAETRREAEIAKEGEVEEQSESTVLLSKKPKKDKKSKEK